MSSLLKRVQVDLDRNFVLVRRLDPDAACPPSVAEGRLRTARTSVSVQRLDARPRQRSDAHGYATDYLARLGFGVADFAAPSSRKTANTFILS
jgi:hypothetical protein